MFLENPSGEAIAVALSGPQWMPSFFFSGCFISSGSPVPKTAQSQREFQRPPASYSGCLQRLAGMARGESRIHGTVERESGGAVDAAKWRCGKDAKFTKGWPKGGLQWMTAVLQRCEWPVEGP